MQAFTLDLWEGFEYSGEAGDAFRPVLDAYLLKSEGPRPAVLILPGSGYVQCSPREAEAVAVRYNAAGWHAFVLWYSCAPRRHPIPLRDCARALSLIRERAGVWQVDEHKVAMMGFSAGGHLALSETLYHGRDFCAAPGIDPARSRADFLLLCYPVITSGEMAHQGSFNNLLENPQDETLRELLSLEKHIDENVPPVFLWHTYTDQSVPVENSLLLAVALKKAGVSLEMHIFPQGRHGMSLAIPETCAGEPEYINGHTAQWFPLSVNWLKLQFGEY